MLSWKSVNPTGQLFPGSSEASHPFKKVMTIPLKLIAANDTFGALKNLVDALDGETALFITAPETNGLMPAVHGLPNSVDAETALIVESSGSTGVPKRISLSRDALLAAANASQSALGVSGQWLLALPITYVAGIMVLVRSIVAHTQPVVMNTAMPFTAEAFARSASLMTGEHRFTSVVPTQLLRLAQSAETDDHLLDLLRRFDAILVGGQAPNPAVVEALRSKGVRVIETYGMTETAGGCFYDGVPLSGVRGRIASNGAIEISAPTLANNVADDQGWFQTSDLGSIDSEGRLKVLGRLNRVVASGGIKVSLDAVEELIRAIGGVSDVAAIAVDSEEWGQRVAIVYVGSPEVADYIAEGVLSELGAAAKPVRVIRVDGLPKLVSGKPDYLGLEKYFEELES